MSREDHKYYFEVLELSPDATLSEIEYAYHHLKRLYSTDSIAIAPLAEEFSGKGKKKILEQIEEAYTRLKILLKNEQSIPPQKKSSVSKDDLKSEKDDSILFSGPGLRRVREKLAIGLYEISLSTKIRLELLENIEHERFELLPQEVYLKQHLRNYASYLSLVPKKVVDDYIERYRAWKSRDEDNTY
ncbi:MAG: helix-turn-helix domain-containing protein [Candidatus Aminicenantaceae bacterium]